ncbi:MAG: ATP-binding protein, partial [Myxococcota bacterium]
MIEERRGEFYLGKRYEGDAVVDEPIRYDAKDLTTHGVCVGMTGSGKTGLCLSLLEEAAIDGVPAICIDPKGDLGNLLLTFPSLEANAFEPWIDPADAERKGQTVEERAESVANLWKNGLQKWGQDGARIARFREAVDLSIYTPGSSAGLPLSVLKGLTAPQGELSDEALRERVLATVSGILALVGVDADPVQSREHVFLSTIVYRAWSAGQDLAIGELIRAILEPPFGQIGVLDVESFYPSKDRQGLAMKLNGLLASPSFAGWLEGEPLDIQRLLYTPDGKPRVSILSIAHLQDAERMFFVTLLLGELVAWMRTQAGTSGLRALLYMDEVMGFLPPVAEPPSKKPLLTLLKQARAFGVGCLLATQNPVDVDYKALSNCGTWFLGRLQTERDVDRVIDGLKGAAQVAGSNLDPKATRATLAGLKSRVFLMNNVHEGAPKLFHTRWALSYLRGPLTRQQIGVLMAEKRAALEAEAASAFNAAATAESEDGNARLNAGAGADAAAGSHAAPSDDTAQSAASMAPIAPEHIE